MSGIISRLLILLTCLSCTNVFAEENRTDQLASTTQAGLKNYSMPSDVIRKFVPRFTVPPRTSPDEIICSYPSSHLLPKFFYVSRKGTTNRVGLIEIQEDGSALLNPEGADYGFMPALKDLDLQKSSELWGTSIYSKSSQTPTYKLCASNQNYYLDLVFKKNELQKYRVRGADVTAPAWLFVR